MKRLFFIRHAETELNASRRYAGQIETPLTPNGREQAKAAGARLKSQAPQIDLIICSTLERTYHTASIVAEQIGYPVENIERNELLVERTYGVLEGVPVDDFLKDHTVEDLDKVENAETIAEVQARAERALEYVKSRPEDNILIVSHGTFGRAFKRAVDNLPHSHEYLNPYRIGNAEILELI